MHKSYIRAIEISVPVNLELNDPDNNITKKIGIYSRHIAEENEFSSDLACQAIQKLFDANVCDPSEIEFLIYCTTTPDYFFTPATACSVQHRMGLSKTCGALDINLACSGYVYGLSLAKGLIENGTVKNVLLVTADTVSKFVNPKDESTRPLLGDGATATLLSRSEHQASLIGPFVFGTDGGNAHSLIIPAGGLREPITPDALIEESDEKGNVRTRANIHMNGFEVFNFTLKSVTRSIASFLEQNGEEVSNYDYFVFHQANEFMITTLRDRLEIPKEKFSIQLKDYGNTSSSSIPIALFHELQNNRIKRGDKLMLAGFGAGLSWAVCSLHW